MLTTPRLSARPPTMTGCPRSSGRRACSTEAKKASMSISRIARGMASSCCAEAVVSSPCGVAREAAATGRGERASRESPLASLDTRDAADVQAFRAAASVEPRSKPDGAAPRRHRPALGTSARRPLPLCLSSQRRRARTPGLPQCCLRRRRTSAQAPSSSAPKTAAAAIQTAVDDMPDEDDCAALTAPPPETPFGA